MLVLFAAGQITLITASVPWQTTSTHEGMSMHGLVSVKVWRAGVQIVCHFLKCQEGAGQGPASAIAEAHRQVSLRNCAGRGSLLVDRRQRWLKINVDLVLRPAPLFVILQRGRAHPSSSSWPLRNDTVCQDSSRWPAFPPSNNFSASTSVVTPSSLTATAHRHACAGVLGRSMCIANSPSSWQSTLVHHVPRRLSI